MAPTGWEWQTPAALSVVTLAAGYLLLRVWRSFAGGGAGCGSCSACPDGSGAGQQRLVSINVPAVRRDGTSSRSGAPIDEHTPLG